MPIYNSKDLIPFVNQLESKIISMNESVEQWDQEKYRLISAAGRVASNTATATTALIRADEAMAEIGAATFTSSAARGKRLEDVLNNLKADMYEIASQVGGGGGGGSLTEGMFFDELNNAIASVDATIEDGLKLDYRLRELSDSAKVGVDLSNKGLHMPYKYVMDTPASSLKITPDEGVIFVDGDVTVLNEIGDPFLDEHGKIIQGTIDVNGEVKLTGTPPRECTLYFPVQLKLKDIPEDFLYLFMQQIVDKNSRVMEVVLNFEDDIKEIVRDIEYMKGVNWTPDYSIMRNYQEIVKEGITPKGLQVEVADGLAHATFSYNDHPSLSHFILERWDEEQKQFVPYDGEKGIVQK